MELLLALALLAPASTLPAATVANCDEASLRAAMSGGGLVTFDCDGTITLTTPIMIVANVTIDAVGRRVIIAGGGTNSLFLVGATRQLTLRSLTLSNGTSAAGGAIRSEAGIVSATNCSFTSNTAVGSSTAIGGAIFNNGGSLNVVRCTFSNNRAYITGTGTAGVGGENGPGGVGGSGWAASGGAIWNSGLAFIHETYFVGNTCTGGVGGTGGVGFGGFVGGSGGVGGDGAGGAVFHESSTMEVTGSTFASNSVAGGSGGTGGNGSGAFTGGNGGTGGVGGTGTGAGIHAHTGAVLATNNTWFRNRATGGTGGSGGQGIYSCSSGGQGGRGGDGFGGAIFASSAASIISHSTLALNAANAGSGGAGGLGTCITTRSPSAFGAIGTGQGGGAASLSNPMTLTATIFAFNLPGGGNSLGSFIDTGFNISSDATPAFTNQGGWNNLDPRVLPLTNNGGPTPTIALQPDSPAIDHCAIGSGPPTDQRGVGRTNGLACDAGAYEFEQPPGLTACDADSLRASVAAGGVVSLGCDGTYSLTTPLVITNDTTIDASGRSVVLSGGSGSRVILVNPGVTLNLIHVTIKDGMSTNGAGIYNDGGIVTLIDCIMATNKAVGLAGVNGTNAPLNLTGIRGGDAGPGTDARGGGIFNAGVLRITNSAFLGNRAQGGDGGAGGRGGGTPGVYDQVGRCFSSGPGSGGIGASGASGLGGAIYNLGEVVMKDVSIAGNRAIGGAGGAGGLAGGAACPIVGFPFVPGGAGGSAGEGRGGAIFNQGQLDLSTCALFRNSADGSNGGSGGAGAGCCSSPGALGISGTGNGGAIYNLGTNRSVNVTMAYNTVRGGNCADAVGGAIDNAGQVRATNCTIWANTATGGSVSNGCPVLGGSIGSSLITRTNAITILVNSIVGNADSTTNCVGVISDGGHNICSDASAAFSAPGSLNSTAPKLGPLADNGGPTRTIGLEPGSPAIDAGDSSRCPSTDQRGVSRPVGVECDVGAFEGTNGWRFPELTQSFQASSARYGEAVRLIFTVHNPNPSLMTDVSFTNFLGGLRIASLPDSSATCLGAIIHADPLSHGLSVSGIGLGPGDSCTVSVSVSGFFLGNQTNVVQAVSSAETGSGGQFSVGTVRITHQPNSLADLHLNGTNQYIYTQTAFNNPQVFALSLWLRTETSSGGLVLGFGSQQMVPGTYRDRFLYLNNAGQLAFAVWAGGPVGITSTNSYNDGLWHHAAATLAADGMKLFADGRLVADNPSVSQAFSYNGWWRIGYGPLAGWPGAPSSDYFQGEIDEVQIWNRALSGVEIRRYMTQTRTGAEPGLVSYWRFDENAGEVAYDASGHDNTGILVNAPAWFDATSPVLEITPISRLPDGRAKLQFLGQSGSMYKLQTSINLIDWADLVVQPAGARGLWEFTDTESANLQKRFYRLAVP